MLRCSEGPGGRNGGVGTREGFRDIKLIKSFNSFRTLAESGHNFEFEEDGGGWKS